MHREGVQVFWAVSSLDLVRHPDVAGLATSVSSPLVVAAVEVNVIKVRLAATVTERGEIGRDDLSGTVTQSRLLL
jgi:hypothetical protein